MMNDKPPPPQQPTVTYEYEIGGIVRNKPGRIQFLGWLILLDVVVNFIWGLVLLWTIICSPGMIYVYFVGTVGAIYASHIMPRHPSIVEPNKRLAWLQIVNLLTGNLVSPCVGIASLIIYRDREVQAYYQWLTSHGQKPRTLD